MCIQQQKSKSALQPDRKTWTADIEKITGEVIGFIILIKGKQNLQLYITGDTVFYEGVQEVSKKFQPKYQSISRIKSFK